MKFLFNLLETAGSYEEFMEILNISLTDKEQEMIQERWRIIAQLNKGLSQRKVAQAVGCSIGTVTRGAKVLRTQNQKINHFLSIIQHQINEPI